MKRGAILLVDDNRAMLHTLRGYLEQKGYEVTSCADGRSALSMAATASFDVILTDYHMPEMDGAELVRRMRERHVSAYCIGFSVADKERSFLEAGADQFIRKDQLLAALDSAIDDRNREERARRNFIGATGDQ